MFQQTDLFVKGSEGYHTFRVPSIVVTTDGTLLAVCEGRKLDPHDSGDIDIVLKRSEDSGESWSTMQVLWDDGPNTCGNPCLVVDGQTGTICLLLTHNLGQDVERKILDGESEGTRTVWVANSTDDGVNWTAPVEITDTTKKPDWTWYATGPGSGIQLANGRLLIPCDHVEAGTKKNYSHVVFSDDGGKTWQLGGSSPTDQVNECEVVELEDGRILLNMRSYDPARKSRFVAFSTDGGQSWSNMVCHETLIDPICQASIHRLATVANDGRSRILFSNPASRHARERMTVRLSYDEAATWPVSRVLHAGPAAYSSLAVLPDRTVCCFFERGADFAYEQMTLARFDLDWLTEGKDRG